MGIGDLGGINFDFDFGEAFSNTGIDDSALTDTLDTAFEEDLFKDIGNNIIEEKDGFFSTDDLDQVLEEKLGDKELFSSLSQENQELVKGKLADQFWEQAGAKDGVVTEGVDIQNQEYLDRIANLEKEMGENESVALTEIEDPDVQEKIEELGIHTEDGTISKENLQELKDKLATLRDEDASNDISFSTDGELSENEIKALDINGDGKFDEKDGDFKKSGSIDKEDKSIDLRSEEAQKANKTEAGTSKNTLEKIMKVLSEVTKMIQAQKKATPPPPRPQAPAPMNNIEAKNQEVMAKTQRIYAQIAKRNSVMAANSNYRGGFVS